MIHKKEKENSNADALRRASHMVEALPFAEDKYAKFHEIEEPVIQFEGGVNEIQHKQCSMMEVAEFRISVEFRILKKATPTLSFL